MQYLSTRGQAPALDFEGVTLAGLAPDGGLYLPTDWPRFTPERIREMRGMSYVDLACEVMLPFVGESLEREKLRELCAEAYGEPFAHAAVTPLIQLDEAHWLLELFHGPTLAFKDIALQLLGRLFETFLDRRGQHLTIVGATSGDTGSAALHGVMGRPNIDIVMLHPAGRISEVQRRQMTTLHAPNIHNIAIEGSFDDAQAMVKRMFTDPQVTPAVNLGAVNSINWARLMAQVVYYFYAALRIGGPDRAVAFSVPTGNFGDVFAGYVAAQMGLPVERLLVATNSNDILHRALSDGDYSRSDLIPTETPSMDIQVSSNFERLLYCEGGRTAGTLTKQMRTFEQTGRLDLSDDQRAGASALFASRAVTPEATRDTMVWAYRNSGQVIDPHTAVGLSAARELAQDVPIVTLATAHPAKFPDAVERAIGLRPELPARLANLFEREEKYEQLPADYNTVRDYVLGVR